MDIRWSLIISLAVSDLRGGAKGLTTFITCLVLGIFAIAASGSAAKAFQTGLAGESRLLYGGDIRLSYAQRTLPAEAEAWLQARGQVTQMTVVRLMGESDAARRLVELVFIEDNYPLLGDISVDLPDGTMNWRRALEKKNNQWGALAFDRVFNELSTQAGDSLALPQSGITITGEATRLPDTLTSGFAFAPRLIVSAEAMPALGVLGAGFRYQTEYRVLLNDGATMDAFVEDFKAAWPDYATDVQTREQGVNGLSGVIGQLEMFLGFIGLSALIAGGLGVSAAARGIVESRQKSIATLKSLGATGGEVQAVLAVQIGLMAFIAIIIGLVAGALTPLGILTLYGDRLPFPANAAIFPEPLFYAALAGLVAAFAFAAMPLGAGRVTPPSSLFRAGQGATPRRERIIALGLFLLLLMIGAVASDEPQMAFVLGLGAAVSFFIFWGLGKLVQQAARMVRPRLGGFTGQAVAGLAGLGSLAPRSAPALGLGAALLFALVQIQSNLISQIRDIAPQNVPSMVLFQVPLDKVEAVDAAVAEAAPGLSEEDYRRTPMISARLISRNGERLNPDDMEDNRWFLEDGLDVTYTASPREPERLVEGDWWPADYTGDLLVSLEIEVAQEAGIGVDDVLTFDILGRQIDARVINLRSVDWGGFGGNFAVMFSPGTLEAANPNSIVLMRLTPAQDDLVAAAVAKIDPGITIFRVRETLDAAARIFSQLTVAIRVIALVALFSGIAACFAALTAGMRARIYEGAIQRALGADQGQLVAATSLEIALTALVAVIAGGAIGLFAAWYLVVQIFDATWIAAWTELFTMLGITAVLGAVAGVIMAWVATSQSPHQVLTAGELR
ncbi:MAG: hypothetical protein MRY59_11320 [Aquisalinus sp.]|nr:hypothetical protein [Aquisalinus sp.]